MNPETQMDWTHVLAFSLGILTGMGMMAILIPPRQPPRVPRVVVTVEEIDSEQFALWAECYGREN